MQPESVSTAQAAPASGSIREFVGVVGLGTMGGRVAAHLARSGVRTFGFDPAEVPVTPGVQRCASLGALARQAHIVLLSLPAADAVMECVARLADAPEPEVRVVVDLSTIGVAGAQQAAERLRAAGIGYVDSPVSGSLQAAASGELSLMVAAPDELVDRVRPVLDLVGGQISRVGARAGLGQAVKVINNAISGTTLAVTSEALAVGVALGLDLGCMLDAINVSSGRSVASDRKFPEQVLTGAYAHGGPGAHFQKDIGLFLDIARDTDVSHRLAEESAAVWTEFATSWNGADQTEIYRYVRGESRAHGGAGT